MNSNHRANLGLAIVLVLGALLRLLRLGHQGLFLDEAWSWAAAQLSPLQIVVLSFHDPHPPLYYLLLKSTTILPSTETRLRMLSALCSITTLAVTLVFVSRKWNKQAATYAGLFVALSSFDIYYAQEARMYTLLGLLWLSSYIILDQALQGHTYLFPVWSLVSAGMAWTHLYGLLVVAIQLAFLGGREIWAIFHEQTSSRLDFWSGASTVLTIASVSPILFLLWNYRSSGAGGAWIPDLQDIISFLTLSTTGLAAGREHFLDSAHLVLPPFKIVPLWIWLFVGTVLCGAFSVWGILQEWQTKDRQLLALLGILLIIGPIAIAFGYARLFDIRAWAFKPFLGTTYLIYIWSGVGLSKFSSSLLRRGVVFAILGVSLVSLVPYYTTWQKTNADIAFQTLPAARSQGAVLMGWAYEAPVAFYYIEPGARVWGLNTEDSLLRISSDGILPDDFQPIDCDDPEIQTVTDLWIYDPAKRTQREEDHLPICLKQKRLWLFEDNKWNLLKH